ncbi:polyphosphate kinase 1 [Nonlabens arenilitoris]|uniref:Polyphosphate kinase n=1 Tax=Nonlabens arenilitoris TaxID=1217969 RepID=A0A2S7UD96_9FLAO|nr:polyphosphate kinase 1 [Nonlabens arenilitoris]PQJ32597.1 polyphosphate kinase 1 [Nonlabens arenilitoris]
MKEQTKYPIRHRDLNWLSFNDRVLQEAKDSSNPLYERLKFISIFSSNLDEFFRVRVSQLRQIKKVKKKLRKKLALRPNKILKEILFKVNEQQEELGSIFYESIVPELKENGIQLLSYEELIENYSEDAQSYFNDHIKEHIKPIIIKAATDSDVFLENSELYFLVTFMSEHHYGIVNIPSDKLKRFIPLTDKDGTHVIAFIDDIVKSQLQSLFDKQDVLRSYAIKLSRDAELYLEQEVDVDQTLADQIYESLSQRLNGQPTRLLYDSTLPNEVRKNLRKSLGLGKIDMVAGGQYHNFDDFMKFPDLIKNKSLKADKLEPIRHKYLHGSSDYFKVIREKDQLVHFPYMSFDYVQNLINQAASDQDVLEIKISLYRVADQSALTDALLLALQNGKKVTVFIEAKARFDEENNIKWGRIFEEKGAHVIYSYPKIKVHSKVLLILRKEQSKVQRYAYIGTGNFNAQTSKFYCDHGLFTAHKKITKELHRVFKVLQGDMIIPRAKNLLISPFTTRSTFEELIRNEIDAAIAGKPCGITAKMNQLEDEKMIKLLYKANQAGVPIRLIVRGFSRLIPEIKGISDNIYVTSIVDQFLEHGRIYKFHNNGTPIMYTGSADWMSRNLDRRIEVLTPIYDQNIFNELDDILNIQLSDNVKTRIHTLNEDNTMVKDQKRKVRSQFEIHSYLIKKHHSV